MADVFAITIPVEVHPHAAVHLETVENARAEGVRQRFVVQVRQDADRTHRRQAAIDNLVQNDLFAAAAALNAYFVQDEQIYLAKVVQKRSL